MTHYNILYQQISNIIEVPEMELLDITYTAADESGYDKIFFCIWQRFNGINNDTVWVDYVWIFPYFKTHIILRSVNIIIYYLMCTSTLTSKNITHRAQNYYLREREPRTLYIMMYLILITFNATVKTWSVWPTMFSVTH